MATQNHFDVIIIGTGAGGGTLAHKLAPTGKRVLLLERGGYVPREKDNWNPRVVNLEGKYQTKEMWHDKDGNELHPHTNYYGLADSLRRHRTLLHRGGAALSRTRQPRRRSR